LSLKSFLSTTQRKPEAIIMNKDRPFADKRRIRIRKRRIISVIAFLLLVAAWLFGYYAHNADVEPHLSNVIPGAESFQNQGNVFVGYGKQGQIVGYATSSKSMGYGGPISMLVGVNPGGEIIGVQVVEHKETSGFFRLLSQNHYFEQFLSKDHTQLFQLNKDLDAVSGATLSSEAVAAAVRSSVREIATSNLNREVPPISRSVQFGVPEITLVVLYVIGYFAHQMKNKGAQKKIRWVTLLAGAIILGFVYNKPLTLANITSLLAGFWPDWHTNLYWYLLLGGILFVTTAQAKNPYCYWFCPFGSVQEILASLTDAKPFRPRKYHYLLLWLQRGLAYSALVLGLAFRMPSATSPEPFGALFNLSGSWPQFVLLVIVLLTSLIIFRPFCSYLCPLAPVVDYIGEIRKWIFELWREKVEPLLKG
jgi:uncharacterized protein with FMN-binding domain